MSKPSFPKNNPFKDVLSTLKEDLIASRSKPSPVKSEYLSSVNGVSVKVSANSSISQNEIDELSASLRPKTQREGKATKKEFDRPLNPRHRNRERNEAAIEALRNPLDRLVNDPSAKPIVIRKAAKNAIQKSAPIKQASLISDDQSTLLKIISVPNPAEPFTWAKSISKVSYQLDFSSGKQFQPLVIGDEDRDMAIGFDFGTSSSKVTIRDQYSRRSFAIKFGSSTKLSDYLLPSKIYLDGNNFHLDAFGKEFSNLKIKAISSNPSEMDLLAMVAYMGLVIRHARSYFFRNYGASYQSQRFIWRLNLGIPARTAQKFDSKDRFISLTKAAMLCSYGDTSSISIEQAKTALKNIEPAAMVGHFTQLDEELRLSFADAADYFNDEAVHVIPEIMAQIHGFVRSNLWNDQLNPHILLIDVGAGTVDISLCDVIRNSNAEYVYTSKACMVEGLGVSNLVKYRINKVLDALNTLDEKSQIQALDSLSLLDDINYGGIRAPSNFDEMLEGFRFEANQAKERIDADFKNSLGRALWSRTVLVASEGSIPGDETWKPFPVFLCGGGSRMSFYREITDLYTVGGRKARFDLKKLPQPNDFFGVEAGEEYDRLSVAYGLGYWDLGLFLPDFESPQIHTVGDDSPKWSDGFISKDMT
jgi:hypothetical protein